MLKHAILIVASTISAAIAHESASHALDFNNGAPIPYTEAATLRGDTREIQEATRGLWPRQREGVVYSVGKPQVEVTENDDFVVIKTNNIPDHDLHTNNPNCASTQNYTFKIPKEPLLFDTPMPVTRDMQAIGVALNGVVIAGPYDSAGQIAPYHRQVDQCSAHADPEGMYHYHFAPMCMLDANNHMFALDPIEQIGWSFDGYKINGLADRYNHLPEIDTCNGHDHDGEYHYHATVDFPFFMGCYKAKPYTSNFNQKRKGTRSSCPSDMPARGQGGGGRPNFENAEKMLGVSVRDIKRALGPPPGDFSRAAKVLGISEDKLSEALGVGGKPSRPQKRQASQR